MHLKISSCVQVLWNTLSSLICDNVTEAATQVIECRRVLQWTYVFGYYLKDGPEKELFEFLQVTPELIS